MLGDGTIASAGGKVVKNVAGYDLGKLVCGSEGRLALIARVSLRLHPLPASAATLVVETDDAGRRRRARCAARSSSRARSTSSTPAGSRSSSRARREAVAAQVDAARALVGGAEADGAVWDESRERQGRSLGRLRFAPGDLGNVLTTLDEAVVRPAAGHRLRAAPRRRRAPTPPRAGSTRALKERLDPAGVLA